MLELRHIRLAGAARLLCALAPAGRAAAMAGLLGAAFSGAQPLMAQTPAPIESPAKPQDNGDFAVLEKAKAAAAGHIKAGRFADAIPPSEQALRLTETLHGPDSIESGISAHNLGFVLRRANRPQDAQPHLERALAIYERVNPAVHEDTGNVVGELGQIYIQAGRSSEVAAIYERLIARAEREGFTNHIGVAHMRNNLGFVLRTLNREQESESQWSQAIAIYEAKASPEDEAYRLAIEAMVDRHEKLGRAEPARALVANTLQTLSARGHGQGKTALRLLRRMSKLEHAAGRYADARTHAAAALDVVDRDRPATTLDAVEPLNDLARAERALGNYAAAEQYYKRAIAILDEKKDVANSGILNDNLAVLYGLLERFDEAERHHKRAMQLLEESLGREHRNVGRAAGNFGVLLNESGRLAEAESFLRRGLAISEAQSPQDPVLVAVIVDNLAGLLRQTGRRDEAMQHLSRALPLFEKALPPGHTSLATVRNNLGRLLLDMGRYDEAEQQLRRSLDIAESAAGPEHLNIAVAAGNLGDVYAASGQREKARALMRRGLGILERQFGAGHSRLLGALVGLGKLEIADGRPKEALEYMQRAVAIELALRARSGVRARPDRDMRFNEREAFSGLLDALWQTGQTEDTGKMARALEIGQHSGMNPAAVALAALGARAGAGDAALGAVTRERQDVAADWRATDKRLTEMLSLGGDRDAVLEKSLRERLAAVEARLATLDQDLQAKFPRYGDLASPAPLPVEEIRRLLQPDEAAIQYTVTPDATHVWLISRSQTRWLRLPVGEKALSQQVSALRCGLDRAAWAGAGRSECLRLLDLPATTRLRERDALPFQVQRAHALFDTLFGPLKDAIADKQLLIVASGPLTSLPFHVLVTQKPDAGAEAGDAAFERTAWLGRGHAIAMLPSLGSLKSLRAFAQSSRATAPFIGIGNPLLTGEGGEDKRAWARQTCVPAVSAPELRVAGIAAPASLATMVRGGIGNTDMLRRHTPLPETADELCGVAKFVGAPTEAILLGANATERRLKSLSANGVLADARVLHFATHGLLAGEAAAFLAAQAEPSLLLTPPEKATEADDGLLTASEVATLKLDADWVVLSACNTASGDQVGAEALSGLARAFFYAGARSLLVSHWAVDSDATVKLVTGAFEAMTLNPRLGQTEALQRSMLALIDAGGRRAHPAYWAPFVVVGSSGATIAPSAVAATPVTATPPVAALAAAKTPSPATATANITAAGASAALPAAAAMQANAAPPAIAAAPAAASAPASATTVTAATPVAALAAAKTPSPASATAPANSTPAGATATPPVAAQATAKTGSPAPAASTTLPAPAAAAAAAKAAPAGTVTATAKATPPATKATATAAISEIAVAAIPPLPARGPIASKQASTLNRVNASQTPRPGNRKKPPETPVVSPDFGSDVYR